MARPSARHRCVPPLCLCGAALLPLRSAAAVPPAPPALLPYGKAVREAYFQFAPGTVYFNHGGYGATPRPVQNAMMTYTQRFEAQPTKWFGASGYGTIINPVRARLAQLVGANRTDLVYLDNASSGMNAVLRSLTWTAGDIVLLIGSVYAVFPNTVAWLAQRYGVRAVSVPIAYPVKSAADYLDPVRSTLQAMSSADRACVRVALLDHISSYPSVVLPVLDLAPLIKTETQGGALVFVDGAHALGHIHIHIDQLAGAGVDFYVMDGHKWLMSPHGSALLWAAPAVQPLLEPDVISSENGPGTSFQDKFDYIGTRDYGPWCAMGDALDFRASALGGEDRIVTYLHDLATWAAAMLAGRWGTEAVAPAAMTAGLITVRLPIPTEWPSQAQRDCALSIAGPQGGLLQRYQMQVIPFTLHTPHETHWARISAQVYLDKDDFRALADHTLELAASCMPPPAPPGV